MTQLITPQPARNPDPTVKAAALAHLIFGKLVTLAKLFG